MASAVEQTIRSLLAKAAGKAVSPVDVARMLAGNDEKVWSRQMKAIRREAVAMALRGEIVILRKGQPADPQEFKGIYKLALPGSRDART